MTFHIEHITVILNRRGKGTQKTPSQDGGVTDARGIIFGTFKAPQSSLLSLSEQRLRISEVGGATAAARTTGPNKTTQHKQKTRKQPGPRKTSSKGRSGG